MDQTLAPPQRWVIRKPSGDPDAARRLARAYDALADATEAETRRALAALGSLAEVWHGSGHDSASAPVDNLADDCRSVVHALRSSADDLRHYARHLERAHAHHGWSLGRLVTLGAMVVVGTAAIVVAMGAAAPAEAALAATAVEGAEGAAVAAAAASGGAATSLLSWEAAFAAVRPLAPFVVPHVVSGGAAAGLDAMTQLVTTGSVDGHSVLVSAGVGFLGSSSGGMLEAQMQDASRLAARTAEGGLWAVSGTAGQYADSGQIDPLDSVAAGATGMLAPDVRRATEQVRLMWRLHVPQLPLGFASNAEWRRFVITMYETLYRAGIRHATVAFRGSSITGANFRTGIPFDVARRSDWDLALIHADALAAATRAGVKTAGSGTRTQPLNSIDVADRAGLLTSTFALSAIAGRPVRWMIYADLHAVQARGERFLLVPRP